MRIIAGKEVFETVEELVEPRHTALLLVDAQNDFIGRAGLVDQRGERSETTSAMIARIRAVRDRARSVQAKIAYIRMTRTANHVNESPASLRWIVVKRGYTEAKTSGVDGTWGWEIVADLAPADGELIINKRRASAFYQTDLDLLLSARGVRTVILVGASTHGCVEATARDAELRDYYVVVLGDCVTAYERSLHEASLHVMESRYDVITSERLLTAWS